MAGVALATVTAQSLQNLCSSFYACRHLRLSWLSWMFRGWLLPVLGILLAGWLRHYLPPYTPETGFHPGNSLLLAAGYLILLLGVAAVLGITPRLIKDEFAILQSFTRSGGG